MTTSEYLASLGITMQQAHDFIFAHLSEPGLIYARADQYDVTNAMLSEIVGGVTVDQVREYFNSRGYDASVLEPYEPPPDYYYYQGLEAGLVAVAQDFGDAWEGVSG